MYSEALRIMDQNMVKYMIDELKAELSAQKAAYSAELSQKNSEIEKLRNQLTKYEAQNQDC